MHMSDRITMNIPEELIKKAKRISGSTTKTQTVILALNELIHKHARQKLANLKGSGILNLTQSQLKNMRER